MSGSRGDSPDWIRCFQAPAHSVLTLSSDESGSSPSPSPSPSPSRSKDDTTDSLIPADDGHPKTALGQSGAQSPSNKISETEAPIKGTELEVEVDRALPKKTKPRGNHEDAEVTEEDISEKHDGAHASKSRLPLVLSEKVHRTKALIECEGNSIDLSGDVGAVGRVMITDTPSGNCDMYLDLKGTIYRTTIVPSRTFCVVNFGQSEAKIEAIMNDFIQLKPQSNVHEAETMVEGTLEGFSFDSEEEAETMPKTISRQADQNEGTGEQTDGKPKGKSGKTSVCFWLSEWIKSSFLSMYICMYG
uniref:DNA-binding protein BIN4-like n=1 Tax=Rhizophora mucronata TaxID=61149 RepID=A0A2P2K8B7_RHIMU